jgi:geranylgeranyl diphosphate synthase type II
VTDAPPTVLHDLATEVELALAHRLESAELPENLREAVRYGVLGPGKRLRPALALLSCEAVGGPRAAAIPAAVALELIHCFSLVHDDLPAMDDDDLRRGRPTLHVHAGEAMAILAGDVMVSLAFQCLATAPGLDDGVRAALTAELAGGTTGMIAGQVYDTLGGFPDGCTDRERLDRIHHNKTGALLRAACRMGAIAGGASPRTLERLTRYGEAIGIMFQIVDDLLDVTQSAEHIGKATGKDQSAGKLTFPGLLGIEASRAEVRRLKDQAHDALEHLGDAAAPLRSLCDYMAVRTR